MKALIDADIFQYEFGSCTDSEYRRLSWPLVQARIQGRINSICEAVGTEDYQLYLTATDKSNFRFKVATIRPYKGHRDEEKPHYYNHIRNFLVDHRRAREVSGYEADDALSIDQQSDTVICSRDKDLDMVPGWHYSWGAGKQKEKALWEQTVIGGLRCFYKQLLTGDSVDNIPGLFGVGKSSSLLKTIDTFDNEVEMYDYCFSQYEKRFGSYAHQFMLENGRLLWMLRHPEDRWNGPE